MMCYHADKRINTRLVVLCVLLEEEGALEPKYIDALLLLFETEMVIMILSRAEAEGACLVQQHRRIRLL